jgi:hypothetical protein
MRRLTCCWRLLLAFSALSGCVHPRPASGGYNVSSERSDYSPTIRLAVALPVIAPAARHDTIIVVIDSAVVTAPGAIAADTSPVMSELYITALLATRPSAREVTPGLLEPWRTLATSDSVLLISALRFGVPRSVGHLRLALVPPTTVDPSQTWLVFRISGTVQTNAVMLADGTMFPRRPRPGGVRVYACADWSLAGYVDKTRAKALARAYTAAC